MFPNISLNRRMPNGTSGGVRGASNPSPYSIQNNIGNFYCPTLIIVPLTSQIKKPNQPTHFLLNDVRGLNRPAMVIAEQIKTIDKRRIRKYLGKVDRQTMDELAECLEVSLGLYIPEEMEAP